MIICALVLFKANKYHCNNTLWPDAQSLHLCSFHISVISHGLDNNDKNLSPEFSWWWQIRVGQSLNMSKILPLCTLTSELFHTINLFIIQLSLCIITFKVTAAYWKGERRVCCKSHQEYLHLGLRECVIWFEWAKGSKTVRRAKSEAWWEELEWAWSCV